MRRSRPRDRHVRTAVALTLATLPLGAVTAHAHPLKPKQSFALRIGIDDGHSTVRPGDRLTYITNVSNTGQEKTPDLLLTQTLVPGLKLVSSTPKGTVSEGRITWKSALPTGKTDLFSVTVQVGRLPGRLQRLAAVACASTKAGKRPIVCATHSDRLQAPATAGFKDQLTALAFNRFFWSSTAGAGALLVAALVLVRRRKPRLTP
ncbi:MAG: hypothetical protein QOE54_2336 [Streptosporangiaceae bacterium]|nr:hypothetical protein [Streptosporangiaceae bacterium]